MKEYRIVIQKGNSKPYSLWTFSNFNSCYGKLLEMINNNKTFVNKLYYITNPFFNNIYQPNLPNMTYYTIECRNVSDWKFLKEIEKNTNNIIPFVKRG